MVVLKGMFKLEDLEKEPELLIELKEDVREEAETLGEVTSVILYDVRIYLYGLCDYVLIAERGRWGDDHQVQGQCIGPGLCDEDEWEVV